MNPQERFDFIESEIESHCIQYKGYGYFFSNTFAKWIGLDSLPDWNHATILDLTLIDLLEKLAYKIKPENKKAQEYLQCFFVIGTHSGISVVRGLSRDSKLDLQQVITAVNMQNAIAPQFIPEFEDDYIAELESN